MILGSASAATIAKTQGAAVVGVNVVLPVRGGRFGHPGFGFDVGYQVQGYSERDVFRGEDFFVWAEEVPAPNFGATLHVTRAEGAWSASVVGRLAVAWPLRIGTLGGWFPGPGVGVELGPVLSTAGYVGFDGAALVDLPWVEGRAGITWVPGVMRSARLEPGTAGTDLPDWDPPPWRAPRVQVGVFSPLAWPENWEGSQWRAP